MLPDQLKAVIQDRTCLIVKTNPFLKRASEGQLSRKELSLYLFNLMHLFGVAPQYLRAASESSKTRGWIELSEFMESKIPEETGHDRWARDDLQKLGDLNSEYLKITPAIQELIDYTGFLAASDPRKYLVYMSFVEYFTVLAGPKFLQDLETKCGISVDEVTAVSKHEQSDKNHIEADFEMISKLLSSSSHLDDDLFQVIEKSSILANQGLAECAVTPD